MHKAKQFFFAGIISVQERRTAYEPKKRKDRGEVYAGMGRNIAGKTKRELLRKMNHKMSIEEIADVLDMDLSEVKDIIEEQYDTED